VARLCIFLCQHTLKSALAFSLCFVAYQPPASAGQFLPAVNYPVGTNPFAVAVGDFNRDGIPDLAVANAFQVSPEGTISILLGNGDGTFQTALNFNSGGAEPSKLAVGDFNADGKLDLAVANYGGGGANNVSVLLGNGDGTFKPAVSYMTGPMPSSVAAADFNGDGKLDLAVTNNGGLNGSTVSVLLGKGDGTFNAAVNYPTHTTPVSVIAADFNRDGKPDLAVADYNAGDLAIFLGKGDGTFQAAVYYPAMPSALTGPESVATADFNGDGKLDLAVATAPVSVLLGNGDGTFQAAASYTAGVFPHDIAIGDFDSDGKLDLAVAEPALPTREGNIVDILSGNGDGSFQAPVSYTVGLGPVAVAAADLNHDGLLDLAVANIDSTNVSVLLNAGPPCANSPDITNVRASPDRLWPPDQRLVNVLVGYHATSHCGGFPACKLTVTSNDPIAGNDSVVINAHDVLLRAERSRFRPRVYAITIRCTDTSGNSTTAHTTVIVAP
jgi:hypothetical protein